MIVSRSELERWLGTPRSGRLRGVETEPVGTFTTRVSRMHLDWEREGTHSVIVKRLRRAASFRYGESFELEARLLRELGPGLPVRVPRCHHADATRIVLEDVEGLQAFSWMRGATDEHARRALEGLARLHAMPKASLPAWIQSWSDEALREHHANAFEAAWPRLRDGAVVSRTGVREVGDALAGRVGELLGGLAGDSLLHGDAHAENLAPVERPDHAPDVCFLDWQGPRRGNPGYDVAWFIVMSHPVELRRLAEESLVALHGEALRAAGASAVDPWRDYRFGALARFVTAVTLPRAAEMTMVLERCSAAAVDLRVHELSV